jgi:hypothetical protein
LQTKWQEKNLLFPYFKSLENGAGMGGQTSRPQGISLVWVQGHIMLMTGHNYLKFNHFPEDILEN